MLFDGPLFPGEDPLTLYVFGTFILTTAEYWILSILYMISDTTKWPKFMVKYKINPDEMESPYTDKSRISRVIQNVLINQTIISLPIGYLSLKIGQFRGFSPIQELPTFSRIIQDFVLLIIFEEIGFYYVHRVLHHRLFFKRFHQVHHEWKSPIAMAAIYCHPVEHIFCNLLPVFGGLVAIGSHVITCWLWIGSVYFVVLNDHSGYHFPFLLSSEAHDYHHRR